MLPGWAIAVTEPRSEAKAVASAKKLGYDVFYPKIIRRLRQRGQRAQVICPLFPGYFFAWIEAQWSALLGARGVSGLLMDGEEIATIRETTMKDLKERCNNNGVYLNPSPALFQRGQKVRVSAGVLADKIGIYDGVAGQRDAVLFNLLGAQTRVLVKEGTLIAV
jgi:transcriptional antiterminator RfaH